MLSGYNSVLTHCNTGTIATAKYGTALSPIYYLRGQLIAPKDVKAFNSAFDVTPNKYISAIITEKGIIYPPFKENIKKLIAGMDD